MHPANETQGANSASLVYRRGEWSVYTMQGGMYWAYREGRLALKTRTLADALEIAGAPRPRTIAEILLERVREATDGIGRGTWQDKL